MAGDWLKFEISTSDKPEIWLIAGNMSIDPDAVVGKMLRIWAWFDQHSLNGNAPSVTKSLLDRLVGVTGFCNSIISAGWMSENDGEISLTNFERHNGKTAKDRALTAKRVAKHKLVSGNEKVTLVPLPKEEKRREEKNINTPSSSCDDDGNKKNPDYDAIISVYHKVLPNLPAVKLLTDKRRSAIKSCCSLKHSYYGLDFWEAYFEQAKRSDFLMGRKTDWKADFDFLVTKSKFVKVLEGSYD